MAAAPPTAATRYHWAVPGDINAFFGLMLDNIAAVSRILDADTVVVGMRPAVAITLVELGLSLTGVKTALNVERGMALIQARLSGSEADDADDED